MDASPIRKKQQPPKAVEAPKVHRTDGPPEPILYDYGRPRTSPFRWLAVCLLLLFVAAAVFAVKRPVAATDETETTGEGMETDRESTESFADDTSASTASSVEQPEEDFYFYNPNDVKEGYLGVRPMDLSGGGVRNETALTLDVGALSNAFVGEAAVDLHAPLVLILHTHSTEGYLGEGQTAVSVGSTVGRSSDREQNVLAVGQVLKDTLIACGIPTLHCEIAHDRVDGSDTYVGAYDRANETVQRYLALYPSIRYVIDLHRDAVFDGNGDVVRPIAVVDGEAVAQVLMVVGSGDGVDHEGNLALALALQSELNHGDAGICRQILLRPSSYRQDYAPYALLLEIGSVGNSLDEAKRAALLVANALAELIRGERGERGER